jgi:hypothetical protein
VLGNLDQYTQFQTANAIGDAARNPGGAGEGIGLGMGMALGQQMAAGMQRAGQPQQQAPQPGGAPAGPPPLPAAEWYLGVGGQQAGPYDLNGLAGQARGGALTPQTLVWKAGMAQWVPAGQVSELAGVLSSTPPPLPPQ